MRWEVPVPEDMRELLSLVRGSDQHGLD
jgi:hypothetical protein